MDALVHMDMLLVNAANQGREPQHWFMRENDWLAIEMRVRKNKVPDLANFGERAYKGVPVHFMNFNAETIVVLIDRLGRQVSPYDTKPLTRLVWH